MSSPVLSTVLLLFLSTASLLFPTITTALEGEIFCAARPRLRGYPPGLTVNSFPSLTSLCATNTVPDVGHVGCRCVDTQLSSSGAILNPEIECRSEWATNQALFASARLRGWCEANCECVAPKTMVQGCTAPGGEGEKQPVWMTEDINPFASAAGQELQRLKGACGGSGGSGSCGAECESWSKDCARGTSGCACQSVGERVQGGLGMGVVRLGLCLPWSGKRSIGTECPCNATFTAERCCGAEDGIVGLEERGAGREVRLE